MCHCTAAAAAAMHMPQMTYDDSIHLSRMRSLGLPEDNCRWFYQQIILALDYCHKMRISNRDIKLENTLLNANQPPMVKLCDFGYSINESHSLPKTAVGTPGYTGAFPAAEVRLHACMQCRTPCSESSRTPEAVRDACMLRKASASAGSLYACHCMHAA